MTPDFTKIHTMESAPQSPKGVFLLLHGMESHSGWFAPIVPFLNADGYAAFAFDRPGWGKSAGTPRGHIDSYQDVLETISHYASGLRKKYGPVHLAGMSWGGMAALYAALRRPWLFDSVIMLAPGLAAQTDLPAKAKIRAARGIIGRRTDLLVPTSFRPEHFTADPDRQDFIRNDPDRVTNVTAGFCFETLKMRSFIKQTAGKRRLPPTACLLAGDDRIIDNQAVANLCRKAGATVQIFPDSRHTLVFERTEATAASILQAAAQTRTGGGAPGTVWIAGAGAVGGAVASLLAFGGVETGVLVKEKYLPGFQADGLTLKAGEGERNAGPLLRFAAAPEGLPPAPDLLIVAVKSFDTEEALRPFQGKIPKETIVLSLQNGIGNEPKIARLFPENAVVAGSICASVEMPGPGLVLWPDDRGGLGMALCRVPGGDADAAERAETICRTLLGRTGMECFWADGERAAERLKWSKLMLNTGFNALNSLTGLSSGEIMADRTLGRLVVAALREGFRCMKALGLQPLDLPGYPVSKLGRLLRLPEAAARRAMAWQAKRTTEAAFSMRQDVLKNRQHTEIAELNGAIVQTCQKIGLPAPANAGLVEMVEKRRKTS